MQELLLLLAPQAAEDMSSWHACPVPCSTPAEAAPMQEADPLRHRASTAALLQLGPLGQEGTQMAGEKPEMA